MTPRSSRTPTLIAYISFETRNSNGTVLKQVSNGIQAALPQELAVKNAFFEIERRENDPFCHQLVLSKLPVKNEPKLVHFDHQSVSATNRKRERKINGVVIGLHRCEQEQSLESFFFFFVLRIFSRK